MRCCFGWGAMGELADKFDSLGGLIVPLLIVMAVTAAWNDIYNSTRTKDNQRHQMGAQERPMHMQSGRMRKFQTTPVSDGDQTAALNDPMSELPDSTSAPRKSPGER